MSCCVRDRPSNRGFRGTQENGIWDFYFTELCELFPTLSTQMGFDFNGNRLEDWGDNLFKKERRLIVRYVWKSTVCAQQNPECIEAHTFHAHMITRLKCLDLDRVRMFCKDGGWCVDVLDALTYYQKYGTARFVAMAQQRIRAFPLSLKKYIQVLGAESRRRPPSCTIVHYMKERIHRLMTAPLDKSQMPPSVASLFQQHFYDPIRTTLIPFLEIVPCRSTLGLTKYPRLYDAAIFRHVTIDGVSADDIHQFGLSEVERLEEQLSKMPPADSRIYTGDEAVKKYASIVSGVEASPEVTTFFGGLRPTRPCQVKEMKKSDRKGGPLAYYSDATFSVNTEYKHPEYQMEALAFHEAVPGHHTQRGIERAFTAEPRYRYHIHHTAFVEGWAMYTEGLLKTTLPHAERGILESEIFRAVRLVVDTGIHSKGWSYEKAVSYVKEHGRVTDEECVSEVVRYACFPGQALGYHIGRTVFLDIYRRHKDNLVDCHRKILTQGSVPMKVLIRQFLA